MGLVGDGFVNDNKGILLLEWKVLSGGKERVHFKCWARRQKFLKTTPNAYKIVIVCKQRGCLTQRLNQTFTVVSNRVANSFAFVPERPKSSVRLYALNSSGNVHNICINLIFLSSNKMHVSATHIVTVLLFCSAYAAEPNCGFGISKGVHILRLLGISKFDTVNTTRHVCLSVCPHGTTRLPLDGFWWNFIKLFRKSVEKIKGLLKSDKRNGYFTRRRFHIFDDISLNSS